MIHSIIIKILFFITFVYSASVPPLFLYPVLDKIIVKFKPEWVVVKEVTVENIGTSNFSINLKSTFKKYPDDTIITLTLSRKNGNKYGLFGRKIQHKMCDYIKNDKLFYPDILQHSNLPSSCPIEAKDYYISDYRLDFKNLASVMPVGHYKISADATSGEDLGLSIAVYVRALQQSVKGFGVKKTEEKTEPTNADIILTEL